MKPPRLAAVLCGALVLFGAGRAAGGDRKTYLEDYRFICATVEREGAALKSKETDWKEGSARLEKSFAASTSDAEHVQNVMRLLALLRDSHTGVTRSSVEGLPAKFDGLFGGGLWFGWDGGKFVLRGVMPGHALQGVIAPGSVLVAIRDEPAWFAMERERRRIAAFSGISSDHSLFGSLGNRMLPFGEEQQVELTFLDPEGKTRKATASRWGPGGKAFSPFDVQVPAGVEWAEGALSTLLETKWCARVGWLRITGGMDEKTATAFHAALDRLRDMEALILDCRFMGGGGDGPAWEMAGRFFKDGVNNGRHGRIEATGAWQFDGPIVMLQDEVMVSSAETFAWAMSETGRAVTVGRATGGWGIIPKVFQCPSGLVDFRLGVNDRPTPIQGVHTEGVGWPPDICIPFGPVFCGQEDAPRSVGLEILHVLHAGFDAAAVRADFQRLFQGEVATFQKAGERYAKKARGFEPDRLARVVLDDLKGEIDMEAALLDLTGACLPGVAGSSGRVERLLARGRAAGLKSETARLDKMLKSLKAEAAAQEQLFSLLGEDCAAPAKPEQQAFLKKHGKTRTGRFAIETLWK
ncbi:MAG: hypothetical protein HY812_00350 [Planctomycetes bacterium]|nr:hypothetical protein [Planctomycetota bacterium]